jgi:hypothetical protein
MIPTDLRSRLVEALMRVPLVGEDGNRVGRDALLAGIPRHVTSTRNEANARGDVMILVLQLEESFGPAGEWRLLQFIDNAIPTVLGSELARELRAIRQELEQARGGARPAVRHPAEVAQVHLFDLRRPVLTCIGMLPPRAAVSGFVLPSPTPRLMGYFCESLKHRGVDGRAWSRDQVAPPRPTLEIDPVHTTVAGAVAGALKMGPLLSRKHVIWPAYVRAPADAEALWRGVSGGYAQPVDRHLVVIFGMPAGVAAPAGMFVLPAPQFSQQDVASWLGDIARVMAWEEAVVQRWAGVIVTGFAAGQDDLPIDGVYDRLEYHRGLLVDIKTQEALVQALEDLELIGG